MMIYQFIGALISRHAMAARVRRHLSRLMPYRPHVTRETWEAEYASGRWDYLRQPNSLAHYAVIAGYCRYFSGCAPTILDVGCGEGILQEYLVPWYAGYAGIDIAAEAIRRAAGKQDEKTVFVMADASSYTPDERFDIIIFNECLYYFENPLRAIRRYEHFLKENGVFIVSMYIGEMTARIWEILEGVYTVVDEVRVSHKSGHSWIVKVFRFSENPSDGDGR